MVVPYQVWMLGRELLELDALLEGCRIRKVGGRLAVDAE